MVAEDLRADQKSQRLERFLFPSSCGISSILFPYLNNQKSAATNLERNLGCSFRLQCRAEISRQLCTNFHFHATPPHYLSPSLSIVENAEIMENGAVVDVAVFLTAIAYAIVLFRTILRRLKHEKYELDDYVMLAALVFYTVNTVSYPIIVSTPHLSREGELY